MMQHLHVQQSVVAFTSPYKLIDTQNKKDKPESMN